MAKRSVATRLQRLTNKLPEFTRYYIFLPLLKGNWYLSTRNGKAHAGRQLAFPKKTTNLSVGTTPH